MLLKFFVQRTQIPVYTAPEHLLIPLNKLPYSSGQTQCVTTCESNGSCKVKIVNGPPGKLAGSCFPPLFGGSCSGIPEKCTRGSKIDTQCGSPCKAGTRNVWNKSHNYNYWIHFVIIFFRIFLWPLSIKVLSWHEFQVNGFSTVKIQVNSSPE